MAIQKTKEPSKVDAALQRFAEMLIKRMEEMQKDWHKGWIGGGSMFGLPQNISGRTYEGSNAFLLFLHTAENGYKAPVYMTYGQLYKEGAHVLKGEKAVPVFKWGFSIKDKDGKKVTEEEFHNMTDDEKKECKRRPFLKIYPEFNIDQTNMSEVNKEKYDAVVSQFRKTDVPTITDGMYVNKAIDRMMEKQEWVCKIQYDKEEKGAYYSPAKDIVVLPTKAQFRIHPDDPEECFKDGQEYYGTALHEMAHSTGHPSRLDRLKPAAFGSPEYAKEELVAELTSAMVGNTLGFDRRISDNNVAYLQNWTSALRKEPKFIVTVMADVNKASRIIIENIDKQRIALGEKPLVQGALDGVEEKVKNEQQFEEIKADQKKEDPREVVAKEWDSLAEKPTVEMESGDVLPVEYNKENDTLDVLITNEAGKQEVYSTNYDHDRSIEENVGHVWEELSNLKQYQAKEVKEETSSETAKDLGDGLSKEPEINDKEVNSVPIEDGKGGLTPKEYFSTLMATLNDGQHDGHTALGIKNISELRDYFKDNHNVSEWVANATDKEIIEAGADMLPNIRYNHKEGRTLYDMEAAYSNINAKYEDVSDDRTRQIAHRIDQAKSIITAYHTNIENAHGENYLFEEESAHKIIPREEYAKSVTQEQTVEPTQEKMDEIYYFSHTYLQSTDSREELDNLVEKQDYDSLLYLTREYDQGDALLQSQTYKNATKFPGDDILAEDDNYAVVYNSSLGGNYDLMRKVTKQDIIDNIERYGLESDASDDVKKVAYENVAKQFSDIKSKIPAFTMPNEDVLYFQYNKETDKIEVGTATNNGLAVSDTFMFERDKSVEANLANVYEEMSQWEQYREEEPEEEESLEEEKDIKAENTASISQGRAAASERSNDESYCYSFARFESSERTKAFDSYRESGDHEALLHLAEIMDVSNLIELNKVRKNIPKTSDDKVLVENSSYAVTYNQQNNTYDLLRKIEKKEVLELIDGILSNDEIKASSDDVQKLAYEDAAQQIADSEKSNVLTMPNGEKLDFQYSEERNQVDVGKMTPKGMDVQYIFDYDISRSPQRNISTIQDELSHYDEFRILSYEEEEQRRRTAVRWRLSDHKFEMPSGDVLTVEYDQKKDTLNVAYINEYGKPEVFSTKFRHEDSDTRNVNDLLEKLEGMKQFQAKQEDKTSKDSQKGEVPHEDSLSDTNVVAEAKHIAATGVPIDKAEKMAKEKFEDINHENMHKEEDKKQDQAKAEKEQAEKEKQQQESKKDEDKPSKGVVHAAILLGALAAAKANDGVWMNKESKSNAEFIFSHTPVTAYNNIMMNLQSDQKGYRTNVFTSFNNAQKNGVAVKQGEKATPFNWTQWDYQNLTDKNDIISNKEYEKLSDEEKKMYGKHASRLTQYIYNIDQTTYPAVGGDQFVTLLKEKGAQQESLKPSTSASFLKQFDEIKAKHPDAIVIMRKDDSYEIYKSDAKKAAEATHLPVTKQEIEGKKIDTVSFSHTMLDVHLPNIIRAGHRVAVCDQLEDPKLVKSVPEGKAVLDRAYSTAKAVAKQEGIKYERVMVIQDAKYDKTDDKIEVSGMIDKSVGSERLAALQKANDIYRAVVAATGTENRLDRSGRNSLLPEDDAKHEKLVQELAAGVLMARQGLPATLSKESQKLIPYWERELKENPKMVGVIERDVNNAVETIDNLIAKRKVDYKSIRGQLPPKMITDKAENYSLAADLAKLPSIDTKEVVVIRDRKANKVDVILPAGASVEANNEVPGMRKDRISIALKKEGFNEVKFYNAGGSLGLNKPNTYFEGKDVSLNQLKQYQLVNHKTIEVAQQPKQENKVEIEHFRAIKDDYGRWAFYIKPKNEPQFSVYPPKEHMNKYFSVRNTPDEKTTRAALANKWYEVAKQFPDVRVDIINPHPAKDIDMSRIVNPTITKSAQDPKVKLVFATIDGERHHAPVNETQWQRMWLADNMAEYKKAVAAVVFEPVLRKGMESQQTQSEVVKETEKVEVKEAPKPEKKQEEQEEQSTSRGLHF